jgi:hypothetical protein
LSFGLTASGGYKKAATVFRGGNFFVRANDLSGFKGMMESFGRISLFPGFAPGIF